GRIQVAFASNSSLPHIRAGRLVALAVTSARRSSALPELPTIAESGVPGYEASGWYGVLAPARTPRAIIVRLHDDIARILREPEVRAQLAANTIEVAVSATPNDFNAFLVRESAKWSMLVKESGAKAD
ncbi:MAG TPA: tripartite tricarboxylate transporter substrate-binding protein, partial [Burkholderiales bacterium]|nr:tripartite tricarboxylate transporter substrate-binding protein [Burkholderiales bacterium]